MDPLPSVQNFSKSPESIGIEQELHFDEFQLPKTSQFNELIRYPNRQSSIKAPRKRNESLTRSIAFRSLRKEKNSKGSHLKSFYEEIPDEFPNDSASIAQTFVEKEPFQVNFPKEEIKKELFCLDVTRESNEKKELLTRENSSATTLPGSPSRNTLNWPRFLRWTMKPKEKQKKETKKHLGLCGLKLSNFRLSGFLKNWKGKAKKCQCRPGKIQGCCALAESLFLRAIGPDDSIEALRAKYNELAAMKEIEEESWKQIQKDVPRTFPKVPFFQEDQEGSSQLFRLLRAWAAFDPQQGYVQGMSTIAGSLLFHGTEASAFWSFVTLYEKLELRNVFLPGFPSIQGHLKTLDTLISLELPSLHKHMTHLEIQPELIFLDWFLSMGSAIVPLKLTVFPSKHPLIPFASTNRLFFTRTWPKRAGFISTK